MGNKPDRMAAHIENAKKTRAFTCVGKMIREIPVDVMDLAPIVRTFDVSNNKLRAIPLSMGNFIELKQLTVEHNKLEQIPDELYRMKRLEVLQLGYNVLTEIPSAWSKFVNLKSIHLQCNQINAFPQCLCALKTLDFIDLSENVINKLPEHMENLQAIELNLNKNQIGSLPGSLAACPRLKVLRLEENVLELSAITRELLKNSQVSLLAVEGNLFQMKELVEQDGYDKYMERFTATKKKLF